MKNDEFSAAIITLISRKQQVPIMNHLFIRFLDCIVKLSDFGSYQWMEYIKLIIRRKFVAIESTHLS